MKYKIYPLIFLLFSGLSFIVSGCNDNKQTPAEKNVVARQIPADKLIGLHKIVVSFSRRISNGVLQATAS